MRNKKRRLRKGTAFLFTLAVCLLAVIIILLAVKNRQKLVSASPAAVSNASSSLKATPSAAVSAKLTSETKVGGLLMLVNKSHKLSESFTPNLVSVPDKYYCHNYDSRKFDKRAAQYLINFLNAGDKAGYNLTIYSGYRTYQYQQNNFNSHVNKYESLGYSHAKAVALTAAVVAPPGTSEHETGLAADIISMDYNNSQSIIKNGLEATVFDKTSAYKWLYNNCAKYGFILRYLKNKTKATGYDYESWHFRFVGVDSAKKIMKNGQCLEEFVASIKK